MGVICCFHLWFCYQNLNILFFCTQVNQEMNTIYRHQVLLVQFIRNEQLLRCSSLFTLLTPVLVIKKTKQNRHPVSAIFSSPVLNLSLFWGFNYQNAAYRYPPPSSNCGNISSNLVFSFTQLVLVVVCSL